MYSIFCAFAVIFVITVVPETKGHTLDEISKLFVKNSHEPIQTNKLDANEKAMVSNEIKCIHCGMLQTISSGTHEIDAHVSSITKL